ncbi:biotin transporter BioY [Floccifex sp.]|uniref:biotin transporter BioY n=1 Tax=Floccifex sp. TaxID=2815810 RepID=UPI002A760367|nr:biotin transporter BioY [Floccifex sp.]MDD7280448.1 biotin transporter BioY [Erysipelotrichaceae bacterium]MDY2957378.1 biotin transporter BioY [Floccifex sp.]
MKTRDVTYCALFTALIAIGSKIQIPLMAGMHFTLQWLFVLLAGLLLNRKNACLCLISYLILGLVGIPVFASGGGFSYLVKPTFGFLFGFLVAIWIMTSINKSNFIKTIAGLLAYYGCGFIYYYGMMVLFYQQPIGFLMAFVNCFMTIIPDFILCLVACELVKHIKIAP